MNDERFARLLSRVEPTYDNSDPSHDFAHVKRVMGNAAALARRVGADLGIVLPAALLHDIVNVAKDHPDRIDASRQAAQAARILLEEAGYTEEEISRVATVIVEHSYSRGLSPSSLESAVMQDADRLDALGAVGMMRTVTCGAKMGSLYHHPEEPVAITRTLDDKRFTLDHLEVKLFKLAAKMNTEPAKIEAEKRTAFMRTFLAQLQEEIRGLC
jgi:uncharacterized protein